MDVIMKNTDKLHSTGTYNHEIKMDPVILKFNSHCFKGETYHQ